MGWRWVGHEAKTIGRALKAGARGGAPPADQVVSRRRSNCRSPGGANGKLDVGNMVGVCCEGLGG